VVLNPVSKTTFAQSFAATANLAARPNFEFAFNMLQNSVIDRLNKEITIKRSEVRASVTPEMLLKERELNRKYPLVQRYETDLLSNRYRAAQILDNLATLRTLSTAGDQAGFDALRAQTEDLAKNFISIDGSTIGLNVDDGFRHIAATGLEIGTFASYADGTARQAAINAADTRVSNGVTIANLNAEVVYDLRTKIETDIAAFQTQIAGIRAANEIEAGNAIEDLRRSYGRMLEGLSLAFEVAQERSRLLSRNLFFPAERTAGSPVNIIT
jgi:hypothetical protein